MKCNEKTTGSCSKKIDFYIFLFNCTKTGEHHVGVGLDSHFCQLRGKFLFTFSLPSKQIVLVTLITSMGHYSHIEKEVNECMQLGRYPHTNFSKSHLQLPLTKTLLFLQYTIDL